MDGKPVNLRQYRKQKARTEQAKQAETNRVVHGTPKALRDAAEAERLKRLAELDGKKRDSNTPED